MGLSSRIELYKGRRERAGLNGSARLLTRGCPVVRMAGWRSDRVRRVTVAEGSLSGVRG